MINNETIIQILNNKNEEEISNEPDTEELPKDLPMNDPYVEEVSNAHYDNNTDDELNIEESEIVDELNEQTVQETNINFLQTIINFIKKYSFM